MSDTAKNALSFVLILCVLLTLFSLSSGVLAADSFLEIENVYAGQTQSAFSQGTAFAVNGNTTYYAFKTGSSDVYCFSAPSGSNTVVVFVSDSSNSVKWGGASNIAANTTSLTLRYNNSLYYNYSTFTPHSSVPSYASINAGLAAFESWTPVPPTPPEPVFALDYSLPPGNVAYIKLPDSLSSPVHYTLSTIFPVLDLSSYSLNNQVSTVVSTIPSGLTTAPSSPIIPWTASGKLNLFGLSRNQSYQSSIPTSYAGYYLLVCNPLYYPVVPTGGGTGVVPPENGSINISISSASSITVFPLDSRLQFTGTGLVVDATSSGESYSGVVDSDTGSLVWTDPDGGDTPPVVGGNTQVDSVNDSIYDYLRNIVQSFSEFLRGPVDAVRTVVNAIRSFMGSFVQLYEWLPSPVYNLITSALMIALTIGVIKIFV